MFASALLLTAGCAAQIPVSERIIKAIAVAHPPIGKVVPVFVAINCENCAHGALVKEPFIERRNIYALNGAGQYIPALTRADAERDAGGAAVLAPVLTNVTDGQAMDAHAAETARQWTFGRNRPSYLFLQRSTVYPVEDQKFWAIALQESSPVSGPEYLQLNYNNGWVFFPIGHYTGVRLDICEFASSAFSLPPSEVTCEARQLPWVEHQTYQRGTIQACAARIETTASAHP
jgi:hypothetical protein